MANAGIPPKPGAALSRLQFTIAHLLWLTAVVAVVIRFPGILILSVRLTLLLIATLLIEITVFIAIAAVASSCRCLIDSFAELMTTHRDIEPLNAPHPVPVPSQSEERGEGRRPCDGCPRQGSDSD